VWLPSDDGHDGHGWSVFSLYDTTGWARQNQDLVPFFSSPSPRSVPSNLISGHAILPME
jgi:hypothetical protein